MISSKTCQKSSIHNYCVAFTPSPIRSRVEFAKPTLFETILSLLSEDWLVSIQNIITNITIDNIKRVGMKWQ